jgi:hypothetical protein
MSVLRLLATATVVLVLMLGMVVSVTAQEEALPDPMAPAFVTGSISAGTVTAVTPGYVEGIEETRGAEASGLTVVSSDPRLAGSFSSTGNWDGYCTSACPGRGIFQVRSAIIEIRGEAGSWRGPTTALASEEVDIDTMLLTGEGAYGGLSAYLGVDWSSEPTAFQGAIFPREMPPTP